MSTILEEMQAEKALQDSCAISNGVDSAIQALKQAIADRGYEEVRQNVRPFYAGASPDKDIATQICQNINTKYDDITAAVGGFEGDWNIMIEFKELL